MSDFAGRGGLPKWKSDGNCDRLDLVADLAQLDLTAKGGHARVRALLEDYVDYCKGVYPTNPLALAVWFAKAPEGPEHNLLLLFKSSTERISVSPRQSLLWKTGLDQPPFVNIHATSVGYFHHQLSLSHNELDVYFRTPEILHFDKHLLTAEIIRAFNIVTEPPGLIKGWYVRPDQYDPAQPVQALLGSRANARPAIGIVKTWESPDFEYCRALVHVEVDQRWVPSSPEGIVHFSYYCDWEEGRLGYFLLQGGALYQILKFEIKNAPDYSDLVLEKPRDDRYPEVYLRSVRPPQQSAT